MNVTNIGGGKDPKKKEKKSNLNKNYIEARAISLVFTNQF